jgi:ATP-dependent protease ClpP protease subunit
MEGNIYINGLIGSMPDEKGMELIDVIQQVKKQPEATSFSVHINSEGGVVDTGFDIYNYIKSLQLPIKTIGSGIVASIATVVFMSGDTRVLRENTKFMIHLPTGGIDVGTADEIEEYARYVRGAEKNLIDFYKNAIGTTPEAIKPLLHNETWLSNEQALTLGFTTQHDLPMVAKAYFNLNTDNKMNHADKTWIEGLFNKVLGKKTIKNLTTTDADGKIIDFPDLAEDATPGVGDKATFDGNPAEGDFLMPDGRTFVFVKGELTEIKEVEEPDASTEEMEALRAENEQLKTQLSTATTNFKKLETSVVDLKKQITSRFEVEDKKNPKKDEPATGEVTNRALGLSDKIKNLKNK